MGVRKSTPQGSSKYRSLKSSGASPRLMTSETHEHASAAEVVALVAALGFAFVCYLFVATL